MIKNKLFTIITEEPARIEWCARKYCWIRTGSGDNITNTIYGIDPMVEVADGEVVVIYTEKYSNRDKYRNFGKRMVIPIKEIVFAETWDYDNKIKKTKRPKSGKDNTVKLFTLSDKEPGKIEWNARKHCHMIIRKEDGGINSIYGEDPILKTNLDGEVAVEYTETFSRSNNLRMKGKRMIVPLRQIIGASMWD
jgi:hypothetical protein